MTLELDDVNLGRALRMTLDARRRVEALLQGQQAGSGTSPARKAPARRSPERPGRVLQDRPGLQGQRPD